MSTTDDVIAEREKVIEAQIAAHGHVRIMIEDFENVWAVRAEEEGRFYLCNTPLSFGCWGTRIIATPGGGGSGRFTATFAMQDDAARDDFLRLSAAIDALAARRTASAAKGEGTS